MALQQCSLPLLVALLIVGASVASSQAPAAMTILATDASSGTGFANEPPVLLVDTVNSKVRIVVPSTSNLLTMFSCEFDTTGCTSADVSAGNAGNVGIALGATIDTISNKIVIATRNQVAGNAPYVFRCNLDGTSCAATSVAAAIGGAGGDNPEPIVDALNSKLLIVVENSATSTLWLIRCALDVTLCSGADISAGQPAGSSSMPTAMIDTASQKLLAVVTNTAGGNRPYLHRCNLDGSSCTVHDLSAGLGANCGVSATGAIDTVRNRLVVAANNQVSGLGVLYLFICALDGTGCTAHDASAGQPQNSALFPSVVVDSANGWILAVVRNSADGGVPYLHRCLFDGTACTASDVSGDGVRLGTRPSAALAADGDQLFFVTRNGHPAFFALGCSSAARAGCDALCPAGAFNAQASLGAGCLACPSGSTSSVGATACVVLPSSPPPPPVCESSELFDNATQRCEPCPAHSSSSTTGGRACLSIPGFIPSADGLSFFQCVHREACPGGSACGSGYDGAHCAACEDGHYSLSGFCRPCPGKSWGRLLIAVAVLFMGLSIMFASASRATLHQRLASNDPEFYKLSNATRARGVLSLALAFLQITAVLHKVRIRWPTAMTRLFEVLSATNLNFSLLATECSVVDRHSYVEIWLITVLFPFIALAALVVIGCWLLMFALDESGAGVRDKGLKARTLVNVWLTVLGMCFVMVIAKALEPLDCTALITGGAARLQMDAEPEMQCSRRNSTWAALAGGGLVAVAVVLFVTAAIGLSSLLLTGALAERWASYLLCARRSGSESKDPSAHADRLRALVHGVVRSTTALYHKDGRIVWNLVVLARKLAFVLCTVFSDRRPALQLGLLVAVQIVSLAATVYVRPYLSFVIFVLDVVLHLCMIGILGCAIVLSSRAGVLTGALSAFCQTDGCRQIAWIMIGLVALAVLLALVALVLTLTFDSSRELSAAHPDKADSNGAASGAESGVGSEMESCRSGGTGSGYATSGSDSANVTYDSGSSSGVDISTPSNLSEENALSEASARVPSSASSQLPPSNAATDSS